MRKSADQLIRLRRRLAGNARGKCALASGLFATGHGALDTALGGGLMRGRIHELFAAEDDDGPSATGFAVLLALRAAGPESPILWLRTDEAEQRGGGLHAHGLTELGGDPGALVLGFSPDAKALLRSAADAARCPGLKALIVECWGKCASLDLTASRRLALAVEQSGVTLFLLRREAEPVPSAADTRWAVRAAPSQALEINAPGAAMFEIELLRHRARSAGMRWRLEWNRDLLIFIEPALSGAVVPLSSRRQAATDSSGLRLSA
jgi:protein ImuA